MLVSQSKVRQVMMVWGGVGALFLQRNDGECV